MMHQRLEVLDAHREQMFVVLPERLRDRGDVKCGDGEKRGGGEDFPAMQAAL